MKLKITTLFLSLLLLGVSFETGCKTSPERDLVTTEQVLATSVSTAMTAWFAYVKSEQARWVGNIPELVKLANKEIAVREAYTKYQLAGNTLLAAQIAAHGTTNGVPAEIVAAVGGASAPLINLINQLRH